MASGGNLGKATFDIQVHLDDLWNGLKQAETRTLATTKNISSSLNSLSSNSQAQFKNIGYSMMQLAYVADDVQYGFRAIVNNIPQLVMGLGGSAGLAGAVGIAAVAVNQLISHWGYLSDAMQAAWSGSTLDQLQAIRDRAEAASKAFDELAKKPTEMEAAGARGVAKAITEGGTGKVLEAVSGGVANDPALAADMTVADKNKLDVVRMHKSPEVARAVEGAIRARMAEENRKKAAELIGQASEPGEKGKQGRDTLLRFAEANPGAFPAGFAGDIARMDPEEMKRQAALERAGELRGANNENMDRQRNKQDRLVDELNQTGRDNAEAAAKERDRNAMLDKRDAEKARLDAEKTRREKEQAAREVDAGAKKARHLGWRVQDLMRDAREPQRAAMSDPASFWKTQQLGMLDRDVPKKQLEVLREIKRLLADNPDMKTVINKAIAAGPD